MKFANAVKWLTAGALIASLAVNVDPPVIQQVRRASGSENRVQGIPVPAATPQGGVGVAQERGTAVERREALSGRAPVHSAGTKP